MSKPVNKLIDDTELAQYLDRQSEYSTQYRAIHGYTDADTVPTELDRLVLAQANGQVAMRQITPAPRWRRLSAPLAVAAAAVFAVTVVMELGDRVTPASQTASQVAVTDADDAAPRGFERDIAERGSASPQAIDQATHESMNEPTERLAFDAGRSEVESIADVQSITGNSQPERKRKAQAQSAEAAPQSGRALEPAPAAFAPVLQEPAKLEEQLVDAQLKDVSTGRYRRQASEHKATDSLADTSIRAVPQEPAKQPSSSRPAAAPKFDTRSPNEVVPPVSSMSGTLSASRSEAKRSTEPDLRARASANREVSVKKAETKPAAPLLSKEVREGTAKFWLAYMRDLRAAGRNVEADAEWKTYIKAYPKYPVAPDDPARPQR